MRIAVESRAIRSAAALILTWVSIYTIGLPRTIRERRLDQIQSDIWEHYADRSEEGVGPAVVALEALDRAARGAVSDLFWRLNLKGEPKVVSRTFAVRAGGLALLLIVGAAIGTLVAGIGIGTDEYFRDDFPKFARETEQRGIGLVFGGLLSVAAILGAGALYWTLRPYQPVVATLGASAMAAASLLMVGAVTAGIALVDIAEEWTARGSVVNDGVWASAHHVAKMHESLGLLSIMLLSISTAMFSGLVIWKGAVPRLIGGLGGLSGLLLVIALVGALVSEAAFFFAFIVSALFGLLWLAVTGGWLALKGVYQTSG